MHGSMNVKLTEISVTFNL